MHYPLKMLSSYLHSCNRQGSSTGERSSGQKLPDRRLSGKELSDRRLSGKELPDRRLSGKW